MNSLVHYDSENASGSEDAASSSVAISKRIKVDAAPEVNTEDLSEFRFLPGVKTTEITHNVPYEDLAKPLVVPQIHSSKKQSTRTY
ncbi:hypothetical protein BCR33DRAFT_784363 [Rhizoclosmatium globosum]|uniref:Uncharacterized protein n=1 Tax=Rhizoclosmatium globosum TaxID=329046 RepID=A0A1Y2CF05_9FUNG|nr:hypothetical protein BCR33DRAFT_784363 [Rhizoclosmatium globosum]|eukprot:ORY45602.1 hypothetical protein BCR33DRAFT_784363 [Rhizoclosmatium globosum]